MKTKTPRYCSAAIEARAAITMYGSMVGSGQAGEWQGQLRAFLRWEDPTAFHDNGWVSTILEPARFLRGRSSADAYHPCRIPVLSMQMFRLEGVWRWVISSDDGTSAGTGFEVMQPGKTPEKVGAWVSWSLPI